MHNIWEFDIRERVRERERERERESMKIDEL